MPYIFRRGRIWWIAVELPALKGKRREKRESLRTDNAKAAGRILAKVKVQLAEGRYLDRRIESEMTLGELGELYKARMAAKKPRSAGWRRSRWNQLEAWFGANRPIEAIGCGEVDDYVAGRIGAGRSRSTVLEDVAVLRHALRLAAEDWQGETRLSAYRLAAWKGPDEVAAPPKVEPADPDDWAKIRQEAVRRARGGALRDVQGLALLLLARTTGGRHTELIRLERAAVDLQAGAIERQVLKKRRPEARAVEVWGEALEALRAVAAAHPHPFLFANPETGRPRRDMRRWWNAVREKALGKERRQAVRFHQIRHAFGRDFLAAGGSMYELQQRLGHSSIRTTEKYAHLAKQGRLPRGIATG